MFVAGIVRFVTKENAEVAMDVKGVKMGRVSPMLVPAKPVRMVKSATAMRVKLVIRTGFVSQLPVPNFVEMLAVVQTKSASTGPVRIAQTQGTVAIPM